MKINVTSEYSTLLSALTCPPSEVAPVEPINLVQAFYFSTAPLDGSLLRREYQAFSNLLTSDAIKLDHLPPTNSPFQLFTRDIGFTIGERFFISSMKVEIRRQETAALRLWLGELGIQPTECPVSSIEGGDILVDYPSVYVGVGVRTSESAARWLANELQDPWRVIQVSTDQKVLHLDCVFNIIDSDTIIYCPSLIGAGREAVEERYSRRIIVSEQEAFDMACNVLPLGQSRLVVEAQQQILQGKLTALGFRVDVVDWSEIRKFGGLFRCAVCPLQRS